MFKTTNLYGLIKGSEVSFKKKKGFEVARAGSDSLEVTHLQYADDAQIFCDADRNQLIDVRIFLVFFEASQGPSRKLG